MRLSLSAWRRDPRRIRKKYEEMRGFSSLSKGARRSGSVRRVACMDGGGCAVCGLYSLRVDRLLSVGVVVRVCRLSPLVGLSRVPCVVWLALSVSAFAVNGSKFARVARLLVRGWVYSSAWARA